MVRGITLEGSEAGITFLLNPDWSKINAQSVLVALGHAFFTLSLGMGAMLTYGSYMSKDDNVPVVAFQIIILDTVIALIAGVAIFTSVFAVGLDPSAGPGLIFHTIPATFAKMPGGYFFSILFFILLSIAALTSAISLLEVVVAYFVDELDWNRKKAVFILGFVTFLIGLPSALSFNILANYKVFGMNFFDLVDFFASNILLPTGGLLIAIFVGYVWGFDKVLLNLKSGAEDLFNKHPFVISTWKFFLKYLSPVLIFIVLLQSLGILELIF